MVMGKKKPTKAVGSRWDANNGLGCQKRLCAQPPLEVLWR